MFTSFETRYHIEKEIDTTDYIKNEYFVHKLQNRETLVTTRHRAWAILSDQEYSVLEDGRLNNNKTLFRLLEDLGIIVTERNKKEIALAFGKKYGFLLRPPILFIMTPSNRCNLSCIYCHALSSNAKDSARYDMNPSLVRKAIDFFLSVPRAKDTFHIEFQGGEPLIRLDLITEAMDYAEKMAPSKGYTKCSFAIVSNFTLMTDYIAQEIRNRGNVSICTSLDGPPDIHNQQRYYKPRAETYGEVTYWIRRLRDYYKFPVNMLPTCTRNHIGRGKDLVDEYVRLGSHTIYLRYVNRTGRAHHSGYNIGLTAEEYLDLWKEVVNYCIKMCYAGTFIVERKARAIIGALTIPGFDYMCLRRPCGCGISQLTINHEGDIFGCDGGRSLPELKLGSVFLNTYDEIITSGSARACRTLAVETLPLCESCPFGPYCGYCFARGLNEHGTPIPTSSRDFECQVYYHMIPFLLEKFRDSESAKVLISWIYS